MSPTVAELLGSATVLPALTLWQPWAFAVAELGKDVENRDRWSPPRRMVGRALAIHAGLTYDAAGAHSLREAFGYEVARHSCAFGAVVAVAVLAGCVRDSPSKWARPRHFHWLLQGTVSLAHPVPCRGAQGLWQLPTGVFQQVRAQVLGSGGQAREALALPAPPEEAPREPESREAQAWAAVRLSHRAWSKGSARGKGPARQTGTVRIRLSVESSGAALPPNCRYCGRHKEACAACGAWWCSAPGHLRHRCEPGWPRCAHGEPYWATSTERPVPPDCCLPPDWWTARAQEAGAP